MKYTSLCAEEHVESKAPVHQDHGVHAAILTFLRVRDCEVLTLRREASFDIAYSENLQWRRLQLIEDHHFPRVHAVSHQPEFKPSSRVPPCIHAVPRTHVKADKLLSKFCLSQVLHSRFSQAFPQHFRINHIKCAPVLHY